MSTQIKPSWTPGPWKAHGGKYLPIVAVVNGKSAQIGRAESFGQISDEECVANARLISKAPEMAELLREYREQHDICNSDDDGHPCPCETCEKAECLLAALEAK